MSRNLQNPDRDGELSIWVAVIVCSVWNHSERPLKPIRSLQGIERYTD